jgi:hypothetical protein
MRLSKVAFSVLVCILISAAAVYAAADGDEAQLARYPAPSPDG